MEIEAKVILTSDEQVEEVKKLIKTKFSINSGYLHESFDSYWWINEKTARIRRSAEYGDGSLRMSAHWITVKNKTRKNGVEINEENECSVSSDFLIEVMFPLLSEANKKALFTKNKRYTQFGYLEPAEKRFYKIDCGYAWAKDFGDRVPYVEIETITENNESPEAVVNCSQMVRKIFKTLGIDDLVTDKPWTEILGDTDGII